MRQTVKWLLKAVAAGMLALVIASLVSLVYNNPGIHVTNETGVTDYVWQKDSFTSTMTEGIAWNRTDKNGFYNPETARDFNMDILIMGSSQMEGSNVLMEHKSSVLLEKLTGKTVYNIGTAGHELLICVQNLEAALEQMQPKEYVILETISTKLSSDAIDQCLAGELRELPSYDSGLLFQLQRIPYLKLVYSQLKSWGGISGNGEKAEPAEEKETEAAADTAEAYGRLAGRINSLCSARGVQPILLYYPQLSLNADGTASANRDIESLEKLRLACEDNDIIFIDMTADFEAMYAGQLRLPQGFCNTSVNKGHLNRYGHAAIAERLAETVLNSAVNREVAEG